MSSPSVSCSGRYCFTFAISSRSWARSSFSQKTTGVSLARARETASFTQSRMATSFVWHIRQTSPLATSCSKIWLPSASRTRMCPSPGASKVLSWLPYSSAFLAMRPTLATLPIVLGSNAPCWRQSSITAW